VVFGITSDAAVFSEYQISAEAVVLFKNVRSLSTAANTVNRFVSDYLFSGTTSNLVLTKVSTDQDYIAL